MSMNLDEIEFLEHCQSPSEIHRDRQQNALDRIRNEVFNREV